MLSNFRQKINFYVVIAMQYMAIGQNVNKVRDLLFDLHVVNKSARLQSECWLLHIIYSKSPLCADGAECLQNCKIPQRLLAKNALGMNFKIKEEELGLGCVARQLVGYSDVCILMMNGSKTSHFLVAHILSYPHFLK